MQIATVFIVALTTSRMIFPGMPAALPASDASKTVVVPAVRSLTFDLLSGAKADHLSKAEVAVPEGLKVTSPIQLLIDLRQMAKPDNKPDSRSKFVVKTYWGSAEEVPQGQPRVSMSDEAEAPPPADRLPNASHAYWSPDLAKPLELDAAAPGTYKLTTNYCGGTSVTLDSGQDFLAPIDLVGVPKKANLEKPIKITWKTVPRALAFLVTATGGSSLESINWTSSADPEAARLIGDRPLTRAEIEGYVENKVLLAPYTVTCTIPAGAFKGSKSVFVNVTAFGPDKVQTTDGIETRVVVRSTASIPVFGTSYKPMVEDEEDRPPPAPKP